MKLPKLDLPMYSTVLPVSGQFVKYRPYTVKEEKIVLIAANTKDPKQLEESAVQLLENCCSVDISKLHPTDVEWLFIKLRIASVGLETEVDIPVFKCTDENCPDHITVKINLESDIEIKGKELIEGVSGYVRKSNGWLIMFTDTIGMLLNVVTSKTKTEEDAMWDCFVSMFSGDEVINKSDITKEEYIEYIDNLPRPFADKIEYLFKNQPWLALPVKGNCVACGKEHATTVTGILDFLE